MEMTESNYNGLKSNIKEFIRNQNTSKKKRWPGFLWFALLRHFKIEVAKHNQNYCGIFFSWYFTFTRSWHRPSLWCGFLWIIFSIKRFTYDGCSSSRNLKWSDLIWWLTWLVEQLSFIPEICVSMEHEVQQHTNVPCQALFCLPLASQHFRSQIQMYRLVKWFLLFKADDKHCGIILFPVVHGNISRMEWCHRTCLSHPRVYCLYQLEHNVVCPRWGVFEYFCEVSELLRSYSRVSSLEENMLDVIALPFEDDLIIWLSLWFGIRASDRILAMYRVCSLLSVCYSMQFWNTSVRLCRCFKLKSSLLKPEIDISMVLCLLIERSLG